MHWHSYGLNVTVPLREKHRKECDCLAKNTYACCFLKTKKNDLEPWKKKFKPWKQKWAVLKIMNKFNLHVCRVVSSLGNQGSISLYKKKSFYCYQQDFQIWFVQLIVFEVLFGFTCCHFLSNIFFITETRFCSKKHPRP